MLVGIIPIIVGIISLIQNFSLLIIGLIIILFFLSFVCAGLLRGNLLCKFCQQRKIGCPVEQLFSKKNR